METDETKTLNPGGVTVQPAEDGANQVDAKGAEAGTKEVVTTPIAPQTVVQVETIPKSEHEKLIASLKAGSEGTVAKMRKDREALQTKLEELEDKLSESSFDNYLRVLEDKGVDNVDLAKQVVERDRISRQEFRKLQKEQAKLETLREELNEAGRGKAAMDFVKEYTLDESAMPHLLATENEWAMRAKALELHLEKLKTATTAPENPASPPASTQGKDLSKMSDTEKLGWAMEHLK